jgi:hypothetical protein
MTVKQPHNYIMAPFGMTPRPVYSPASATYPEIIAGFPDKVGHISLHRILVHLLDMGIAPDAS